MKDASSNSHVAEGIRTHNFKVLIVSVFTHTVEFNIKNFALCPQNASLGFLWFLKYEVIIIIIIIREL